MKQEALLRAENRHMEFVRNSPIKLGGEGHVRFAFSEGARWMYEYILYLLKREEKELQESIDKELQTTNRELYDMLINEMATIRAIRHYTLKWDKQPVQKKKLCHTREQRE